MSVDVSLSEHTMIDGFRGLELHLRTVILVGGHLYPGFDHLVITLVDTTGLDHLDPGFDHLDPGFDHPVITLVGTVGPTRLPPGFDHPEVAMTCATLPPWMPYASFRAR